MTYSTTKFEVATSNGLGGDTFTRNVTDGRTHRRTDGRRTDFDTKLIYPFFLKKKAGIIIVILLISLQTSLNCKKEPTFRSCLLSSNDLDGARVKLSGIIPELRILHKIQDY